jgi:peptide/nickel transport system permease protein
MSWYTRICASWVVLIIAAAIFADFIPGLPDPNYQGFLWGNDKILEPPSRDHWLGTDGISRDNLARVIYGARVSLIFAGSAVASGLLFGGVIGSLAGFMRGKVDGAIGFGIDVMLAMPGLVIYIFFITMIGKFGLVWMCLVVSVLVIAPYARVARANALAISNREFVTAARSIGTNKARILFREVIPNVYPTLFAYALVSMGVLIILEATLSFLGIGMPIPTSSWGNMIAESRRDLAINPWPCVWPALTLILTVYSINVVADWIRKDMAARTSALS